MVREKKRTTKKLFSRTSENKGALIGWKYFSHVKASVRSNSVKVSREEWTRVIY